MKGIMEQLRDLVDARYHGEFTYSIFKYFDGKYQRMSGLGISLFW